MAIIPCKAINFERQIPPDMIEESVLSNDFFTILWLLAQTENKIGDAEATMLCHELKTNKTLLELSLRREHK